MIGKTTELLERAVDLVADLPNDYYVFITTPHSQWLRTLERDFKAAGLIGVRFISIDQIKDGGLQGYRGKLLIDDFMDISPNDAEKVYAAGRYLDVFT